MSSTTIISIMTSVPLFLLFVAAYQALSPLFKTERQRAYILSTISSATMTGLSIPFVFSYFRQGLTSTMEAAQEGWMEVNGRYGVIFFGTYLFADLAIGYVKYRSQVGLLTGWIHHTVYIALMVYLLNTHLTPIFLTGAIMELPTLDLALSNLFPKLRHDLRFLSSFFVIRIVFNALLLVDCTRSSSRLAPGGVNGSWVPTIMLALAGAMHASWFHGGVKGYLKRRTAQRHTKSVPASASASVSAPEITAVKADTSNTVVSVDPLFEAATILQPDVAENTLPPARTATTPATPGTPDDSPLITPRTPSQTPFFFPTLAIPNLPTLSNLPNLPRPNLANLNLSNLPTVHIPTLSLSDLTSKLNKEIQFGIPDPGAFKDAVRNRWEEQREKFGVNLGALGRRRSGMVKGQEAGIVEDDDAVISVHEVLAG